MLTQIHVYTTKPITRKRWEEEGYRVVEVIRGDSNSGQKLGGWRGGESRRWKVESPGAKTKFNDSIRFNLANSLVYKLGLSIREGPELNSV